MGNALTSCCDWNKSQLPTALPVQENPRTEDSRVEALKAAPAKASTEPSGKPKIEDFKFIGELGKGGYGTVYLVERKTTKERIALKMIEKKRLLADGQRKIAIDEIMNEKEIMKMSKNPFLVTLLGCFQNNSHLCFLMEVLQGGNLFHYLTRVHNRRLSEDVTRFYAAEVVLGLEYLHEELHVMYRDLKPENLLLTEDGHIKLADFGLARRAEPTKGELKGTPDFMAPEMFSNSDFDHRIDYWSLGCLIYELLYGKPAFNRTNDKKNTAILTGKFTFPSEVNISDDAKSIIRQLLTVDPKTRLGTNGIKEIKSHAFFASINWEKMYKKQIKAPLSGLKLDYKPTSSATEVTSERGVNVDGFTYMPETPGTKELT